MIRLLPPDVSSHRMRQDQQHRVNNIETRSTISRRSTTSRQWHRDKIDDSATIEELYAKCRMRQDRMRQDPPLPRSNRRHTILPNTPPRSTLLPRSTIPLLTLRRLMQIGLRFRHSLHHCVTVVKLCQRVGGLEPCRKKINRFLIRRMFEELYAKCNVPKEIKRLLMIFLYLFHLVFYQRMFLQWKMWQ